MTMTYNKITLSFNKQWSHLEAEFAHTYFKVLIGRIRVAIVVITFFYSIFGILDALLVPEQKHFFGMIRFAFFMPIAISILIFSFFESFEKYAQLCLCVICLAGGLGIELMLILAIPPATYSYYAGIILVFVTIHTILPIRFVWGCLCSWAIVICYEIISFWIVETPWPIFINNNFFFISALLLCMISGYYREIYVRQMFFSRHLLGLEKQKIAKINEALDQVVKERTRALHKKQKMEAIGTLAGGIAHDFNNILSAIMGYTQLALMESVPESSMAKKLNEIMKAGTRATDLTHQISTFSRRTKQKIVPTAVKPVIDEALNLIKASAPGTIKIVKDLKSDAWVMGDATQIHRIVMNLCTNGIHAMGTTPGSLKVTLEETQIPPDSENKKDQLVAGSYIVLTISDTGHGMPLDLIDKIFDPFFTTKSIGHGTGMGLSVVHGIVKKYKGSINVQSETGKGSTFSIFLPVCEKKSDTRLSR